jgi:4-hydroxybenzoate polyprenyltransferase
MVDRNDDIRIGIKTSAITFGRFDVAAVVISYAAMLAVLVYIGTDRAFGWAYYAGLVAAAGTMVYHYFLIRGRERMPCFKAFLHNNWTGAAIFAGILAEYALRGAWPKW